MVTSFFNLYEFTYSYLIFISGVTYLERKSEMRLTESYCTNLVKNIYTFFTCLALSAMGNHEVQYVDKGEN